ncbi:hypothetical protein DFH09DRAFT_1334875 [Mycena vulgaris]|nr:hypothetical protein DFH09DRAFT_1334875 [Mycena vulgaris]
MPRKSRVQFLKNPVRTFPRLAFLRHLGTSLPVQRQCCQWLPLGSNADCCAGYAPLVAAPNLPVAARPSLGRPPPLSHLVPTPHSAPSVVSAILGAPWTHCAQRPSSSPPSLFLLGLSRSFPVLLGWILAAITKDDSRLSRGSSSAHGFPTALLQGFSVRVTHSSPELVRGPAPHSPPKSFPQRAPIPPSPSLSFPSLFSDDIATAPFSANAQHRHRLPAHPRLPGFSHLTRRLYALPSAAQPLASTIIRRGSPFDPRSQQAPLACTRPFRVAARSRPPRSMTPATAVPPSALHGRPALASPPQPTPFSAPWAASFPPALPRSSSAGTTQVHVGGR